MSIRSGLFGSRAMNFGRHWETTGRLIFPLVARFSFHQSGLGCVSFAYESKAFCHSQGTLHSGLHSVPTSFYTMCISSQKAA